MADNDYQSFADSIHILVPDFKLNAAEIQTEIADEGFDRFIQKHAAQLAETAEVIMRDEKRGAGNEAG